MQFPKKQKFIGEKEAFLKACMFCSYQERTQTEVREKLYGMGLKKDVVEELISKLITENFINEERFAKTYAGGKFRIKKWGKIKILEALKQKRLSDYCIKKGLLEIPDEDYILTIEKLIEIKWASNTEENIFKKKNKIATYLIGRGFEPDLVWAHLKDY
ncbi:MAG TPA: regulatory protein RecX [Cytophagaceae bacterium]